MHDALSLLDAAMQAAFYGYNFNPAVGISQNYQHWINHTKNG